MDNSARQIPQSEWERHRDTIVNLYREKPLKDVRAEMQAQHGFDASPWKYEMQLKRWNVRKNATRKEWQQYFAANNDRSIPTSLGDAPGRSFSPVVLSKSAASKKRASRWVPAGLVEPSAPRASGSIQPMNEAHPVAALIPNDVPPLETTMAADLQDDLLNMVNGLGGLESAQVDMDLIFSNVFATHDLELHAGSSQAFFHNVDGFAQPWDVNPTSLHAWSSPVAPDFPSPFLGHDSPNRAEFASLGMTAENNMVFFGMLEETNFRQELPSAQLEYSLRSRGIILDRAVGRTIFGGFATKFVAGMLSSNDQSMARRTPGLQHFLRKLGSQVPGESSALITDDQAFETKFARVLLFSMLNGFAGLDDVPIGNILRFLDRFIVNKLLLEILEQSPRHVSRTLANNIFRAAIEATDIKVVNLLLSRKLVDVNETVCRHNTVNYTPIERAAALRSLKLVKLLIDAGADVNKSHAGFQREIMSGALGALVDDIKNHLQDGDQPSIPPEACETLNMLVSAGAQVHPWMIVRDDGGPIVEFNFLVTQNIHPESHRDFFQVEPGDPQDRAPLERVAKDFDDCHATKSIQKVINLCHQNDCNRCVVRFSGILRDATIDAASTGKFEFVQFLLDKADLSAALPEIFLAAIEGQNHALIDLVVGHGPDLDPPAMTLGMSGSLRLHRTPIAEAVRYGNEDLIRKLEAKGCLDRLTEGNRFGAVIAAAAEAGNTEYLNKLLARAVTSKQACRETGQALDLAIDADHQDIIQILLEAGVTLGLKASTPNEFHRLEHIHEALSQKDTEIVHGLIASGASYPEILESLNARADQSIIADVAREYPTQVFPDGDLIDILESCIKTDTPEFFKELLKIVPWDQVILGRCLATAAELGHDDLIEFLLDTGANPFDGEVLHAVVPNRLEVLRLLFQQGRRRKTMPRCIGASILEPVMSNDEGNSEALDELIRTEAVNFARLEMPYGTDMPAGVPIEYRFDIGLTPLGLAIQGVPGRFDTNMVAMKKFLDAGADPNGISKLNKGWTKGSPLMTALMVAIETGREDAVKLLLDYGADVNARPRIRTTRTALQYAAELGNADMVRLFLNRGGADVNSSASPRGGATALQFAAMSGNCNMVADLLDHGAKLDARPSKIDGMWPLEGAAANGRLDMIRYLWELNMRAVAGGTFPDGFLERHCLRAMNFARENGHIGCRDMISYLSGISVDRLETDEYGAPWIAY